jgi:CRP/FNR family transcriptional regulator, cyclic AMP receptor protein
MTSYQLLNRHWIGRLDDDARSSIQSAMVSKRFDRGALLFSRGEVPEGLYVVSEGNALLYLFGLSGRRLLLDILRPGDMNGETFALDGRAATVSVEARTDLTTFLVPAHHLAALSERFPQIRLALAKATVANFRGVLTLLEEQILMSLHRRTVHRLKRQCRAQSQQPVVTLSLTQSELAMMIGVSRQAVNLVLVDLERRDVILRRFQAIECQVAQMSEVFV